MQVVQTEKPEQQVVSQLFDDIPCIFSHLGAGDISVFSSGQFRARMRHFSRVGRGDNEVNMQVGFVGGPDFNSGDPT